MGLKQWQTCHNIAEKSSEIVPLGAPLQNEVQTSRHAFLLSPKASQAIAFERCFITDDRNIFGLSLGDEHTVKWVLVRAGQESSPNSVLCRYS